MIKCFTIIFLTASALFSQSLYIGEIGSFNNASAFHINGAGFLFVADAGNDKVFKLDTLGNVINETGGYGWDASSFDIPEDVFATTLNIFVSDKNNHRIERFDKDLNFISSLSTRQNDNKEMRFGYPLSCAVSNQGDLYVLDSENKRIIKFDLFGNFVQNFGGYDWGKYALNNPTQLAVDPSNNIYAADDDNIKVYDQFGNGLAIINDSIQVRGMNIIFNNMTINSKDKVMRADLSSNQFRMSLISFDQQPEDIVCSLIFNNKLYILTSKSIKVYTLESPFEK